MAGSDEVNRNLMAYFNRTIAGLDALSEHYAGLMEAHAKANRPWEDRTGDARKGLFGSTLHRDKKILSRVSHSMEYGVYLELANQGKYAILEPTVKKYAPDYFRDAERVVNG